MTEFLGRPLGEGEMAKSIREEIRNKWIESGLLDGFKDNNKINIAELLESEASYLLVRQEKETPKKEMNEDFTKKKAND